MPERLALCAEGLDPATPTGPGVCAKAVLSAVDGQGPIPPFTRSLTLVASGVHLPLSHASRTPLSTRTPTHTCAPAAPPHTPLMRLCLPLAGARGLTGAEVVALCQGASGLGPAQCVSEGCVTPPPLLLLLMMMTIMLQALLRSPAGGTLVSGDVMANITRALPPSLRLPLPRVSPSPSCLSLSLVSLPLPRVSRRRVQRPTPLPQSPPAAASGTPTPSPNAWLVDLCAGAAAAGPAHCYRRALSVFRREDATGGGGGAVKKR